MLQCVAVYCLPLQSYKFLKSSSEVMFYGKLASWRGKLTFQIRINTAIHCRRAQRRQPACFWQTPDRERPSGKTTCNHLWINRMQLRQRVFFHSSTFQCCLRFIWRAACVITREVFGRLTFSAPPDNDSRSRLLLEKEWWSEAFWGCVVNWVKSKISWILWEINLLIANSRLAE